MATLPIELNTDTIKDYINDLIAKRTNYGLREVEVLPEKYCIISWSNGAERWINFGGRRHNHTNTVSVDANEVVVNLYRDQVDMVLEELDPLPLYANSFEGKMRANKVDSLF